MIIYIFHSLKKFYLMIVLRVLIIIKLKIIKRCSSMHKNQSVINLLFAKCLNNSRINYGWLEFSLTVLFMGNESKYWENSYNWGHRKVKQTDKETSSDNTLILDSTKYLCKYVYFCSIINAHLFEIFNTLKNSRSRLCHCVYKILCRWIFGLEGKINILIIFHLYHYISFWWNNSKENHGIEYHI